MMRCFGKVIAVLASLLGACAADEDNDPGFDTGAPSMLERRVTIRPPRRDRTPTSGNHDESGDPPCSAGEERWERVACFDVGYAGNPGWDENRGAWVCPRCYEDVCATPFYSESMERDVLPSLIQLPTCPDRLVPEVRR
jgi:hypothetical protein